MNIKFPYGETELDVDVPDENLVDVLEMRITEKVENFDESIKKSLYKPIGCSSIENLVDDKGEIVLIVDDNTRACPDDILAPVIIDVLVEAGVKSENIKILVAYGLHSPLDEKRLKKLLGDQLVNNYHVINHNSDDTVLIGESSKGVPIDVNKEVLDADFRISTGFIEPHFFAGFSGGRKSIMPGVSGRKSIYMNHSFSMISDPNSKAGELEKNPIHLDAVEHSKKAGLDFIVNVVLNKKKEITHVFSGDPYKAHLEGVRKVRGLAERKVDEKADIVITTNSGLPLDLNLYQAVKGIAQASYILKDGGIILMASECNEGIGPDMFYKIHEKYDTPEEVLEYIKNNEPIEAQWENQVLAEVQKKAKIFLKSDLEDKVVKDMIIEPVSSLEKGLKKAFDELGRDAKVVAIPEGPMVIPSLS